MEEQGDQTYHSAPFERLSERQMFKAPKQSREDSCLNKGKKRPKRAKRSEESLVYRIGATFNLEAKTEGCQGANTERAKQQGLKTQIRKIKLRIEQGQEGSGGQTK